MRPSVLALAAVALLSACRDEQAQPKAHAPGTGVGVAEGAAANPGQGVRVLDRAPSDLTFRSGATWAGGSVFYIGSRVEPPNARPGMTVRLTHYFQASREAPPGFRFFLHGIDPNSGEMVFNGDHEIQNGAAPLGTWPLGKVIEDMHVVNVPQHEGPVRVVMGFWNDQGRLQVDDPSAHDGQMRMLGPKLEGESASLPEYHAVFTDKPPAIDGTLDDALWKRATPVTLVGSYDGRPTQLKTTARLAWDEHNVYVAFDCEDPDAWGTLMEHDQPIYNEEVVEVFFDANGDGRTYNELQVSPNNVTFDAQFEARRSDLEKAMRWESQMKTAVHVRGKVNDPSDQDQGWSAEMSIPIANLYEVPNVPPKKGDRWRFNAYRLEHLAGRQQVEGQAFSPLFVGDFHALPRFGVLVFDR